MLDFLPVFFFFFLELDELDDELELDESESASSGGTISAAIAADAAAAWEIARVIAGITRFLPRPERTSSRLHDDLKTQ